MKTNDTEEFFERLLEGKDRICPVPLERWDVDQYHDPDHSVPGKMYVREGGFMNGLEYFDAKTRGEVIRDAHAGRAYRTDNRKKLFPEFDRMTSPKGHLGEF